MQVHLKLTKSEYMALMRVARQQLTRRNGPEDFGAFQELSAMWGLVMKMQGRLLELKEKANLTLTDMEAYTLYQCVDVAVLEAYEAAVLMRILTQIEEQWMSRWAMMRGNLERVLLE